MRAIGAFAANRAARLYPVALACTLATYAIVTLDRVAERLPPSHALRAGPLLRQLLLIQTWRDPDPFASSLVGGAWVVSALVPASIAFNYVE